MIVRVALAIASLVVVGWLALGLAAVDRENAGKQAALAAHGFAPAKVAEARRQFRRSADLMPDTEPLLAEAQFLVFAHRPRQALAVLNHIVDREPDNLQAWKGLQSTAAGVDPGLARLAAAKARALSPPLRTGRP